MKYAMQGTECVKQGFNPICAKFHIFPNIIKGVPFPESIISLNLTPTVVYMPKNIGKATCSFPHNHLSYFQDQFIVTGIFVKLFRPWFVQP